MSETDQCESFEEYWGQSTSGQYGRIERIIAKNAWVCCEKLHAEKLQAAEEEIKLLRECLIEAMETQENWQSDKLKETYEKVKRGGE